MKIASVWLLIIAAVVPAKYQDNDSSSASLKFEFVANTSLFTIPVFVNGSGPFRFLLDTGATHSLLSKAIAKKLAIQGGIKQYLTTANGSVPVTVHSLDILEMGGIRIERLQIAVADFGLLARLQVDGILGSDLLKSSSLFIDYSAQLVRIEGRF